MATPPTKVLTFGASVGWGFGTSKVSTAFDVQTGDLITVKCSTADGSSPSSVTPVASAGSVTWTLRVSISPASQQQNSAFYWSGVVGANATGITVTLSRPSTANVFWGFAGNLWRDHGGFGTTFSGNNGTGSGAPSVASAAACSANSAVDIQVSDWNAGDGTTRTWRTVNGAAETETLYFRNSSQVTVYGGVVPDTGAAGTITQGLTTPSTMRWVAVGGEILGVSGGPAATTVSPTGISSAEAVGSPTQSNVLSASPTAIASAEAVGNPTVTVAASGTTASPTGIASAESVGTPAVSAVTTLSPTAILSSEALGSPSVAGTLTASPAGVGTGEAFGSPTVGGGLIASPTGIASAQTFGVPSMSGTVTISPAGIASAQTFGVPSISGTVTISPAGVASAQAFGTLTLVTGNQIVPSGIATAESFGLVTVATRLTASPTAIPSAEALGAPAIASSYLAAPDAILTQEAFGTVTVTGGGAAASQWSVWDGATESPVTLQGVWDGASVVPVTLDSIV